MLESTGAAFSPRTTRTQMQPAPQMRYNMGSRAPVMGSTLSKPPSTGGGMVSGQARPGATPASGKVIKA
jgi:hypothetical protein